jgi:hypothetical protein
MEDRSASGSFTPGFGTANVDSTSWIYWTVPLPLNFFYNGNFSGAFPATSLVAEVSADAFSGGAASTVTDEISFQITGVTAEGSIYGGNSTYTASTTSPGAIQLWYGETSPVPVAIPADGYAYAYIGAIGNLRVGAVNYCY